MTAAYRHHPLPAKIAAAVTLATGLDFLLAAARGWTLRAEAARTVAMDALLLLPLIAPHANGAYATEVHVPLLVRLPGQAAGRRVATVVHLADVLPTLVDLVGLDSPPGMQGASLLGPERRLPAVSFTAPYRDLAIVHPRYYRRSHWAIYRDPWVLISRSDGERELYDFRADPAQERDLAATHPAEVEELSAELLHFEGELHPKFQREATLLDEATLQRLRALGYAN